MERLAQFKLPVDYCSPCRAKHAKVAERLKKADLPECDATRGKKCEYLFHDEPYQLHPDNWLPLLFYERIIQFSPIRTHRLGNATQAIREFSVDAMRLVLDTDGAYLPATVRNYVIEALGVIHTTYASHDARELSQSAASLAKKSKVR